MQIVRTIVWFVVLFVLLAFSFFNWKPVEVQIWPTLVMETKLPALVIIAFLAGFVPMWMIHRTNRWRMQRKLSAMETATARMAAPVAPASAADAAVASGTVNPVDPVPTERR